MLLHQIRCSTIQQPTLRLGLLKRNSAKSCTLASTICSMRFTPILSTHAIIAIAFYSTSAVSALATPSSRLSMPPLTPPSGSSLISQDIPLANNALSFFDSSPDPFHAVQSSIEKLEEAGFQPLSNDEDIQLGGKYYFTKNKSSLIAFSVPKHFDPKNIGSTGGGFKVIGAHTDSPNLKIKPYSKKKLTQGYVQLAVECYGGGLWHTWFDRDLGLSGRVLVRNEDNGTIEQKLMKVDRPLLQIPNLAIHLQTAKEREAFEYNKEDHLIPMLSLEVKKALGGLNGKESNDDDEDGEDEEDTTKDVWVENQESLLMQLIASELSVPISSIVDFELNLFDVQKANLGGIYSEFIHSARLDNLASCFMAVQALVDYVTEDDGASLENDEDISLIALFDHEEVGSSSATGAGSPIMGEAVKRVCNALCKSGNGDEQRNVLEAYQHSISKSFVLSVDQAHAIHANYASKHEKNHAPRMNGGMVIKRNANQRYATTGITGFIVREIAKKAGLKPVQEFVVRNDCGCGSTIGPIISSNTGMRAIDLGCPQLAMHSIRETMGTSDGKNIFKFIYLQYDHSHFSSLLL